MRGIIIKNDTGIGAGTRIFDSETGQEIHGVRLIEIAPITPDSPIVVRLEAFVSELQLACEADIKEIKREDI